MSGSERLDSKAGPLGNLSQAYFSSLDMMVKGCEPALKGVGRWNLELVALVARRSQAWLEVPARLMQCKTPVDLANEQMRFWRCPPGSCSAKRRWTSLTSKCGSGSRPLPTTPRVRAG